MVKVAKSHQAGGLFIVASVCTALLLGSQQMETKGSRVSQLSPGPVQREYWSGIINLNHEYSGTLEFTRENGRQIAGKINVRRGEVTEEMAFQGGWAQSIIQFRFLPSGTDIVQFKGYVTVLNARHIKIEGKYGTEYQNNWTSELELKDTGRDEGKIERPIPNRTPIPLRDKFQRPSVLTPGLVIDLIAKAPEAQWTNSYMRFGFPGNDTDNTGFARYVFQARLEDGNIYPQVLETHPEWKAKGIVTGRFDSVLIPASGAEFRTKIGFLEGATGTDGVYFQVWGSFPGDLGNKVRLEYFKPYTGSLRNFRQDLSFYRGKTGTLIITVDAGRESAGQDWAVWVGPKVVSLPENEPRLPSFVGGAVGSGRDGGRLINAWGDSVKALYGPVFLYLLFANIDTDSPVRVDSYCENQFIESHDLGTIRAGETEIWHGLSRTRQGWWRDRIYFKGEYVGDLRYIVQR